MSRRALHFELLLVRSLAQTGAQSPAFKKEIGKNTSKQSGGGRKRARNLVVAVTKPDHNGGTWKLKARYHPVNHSDTTKSAENMAGVLTPSNRTKGRTSRHITQNALATHLMTIHSIDTYVSVQVQDMGT